MTVDSVFLGPADASALPVLFAEAKACANTPPNGTISAPNLAAFSDSDLKAARIRKVAAGFHGYLCGRTLPFGAARATTLEIV